MINIFKPKVVPMILEVEAPRRIPEITSESRDTITALASHPGFQYLLAKLQVEKAVLSNKLNHSRHKDLADVAYLQAGVYWSGWLEEQLKREVKAIVHKTPSSLTSDELQAYEQTLAAIEEIG